MSNLKKIFVVIACVLIVIVSSFLIVICNKKQNVGVAVGSPYSIVVYNKSAAGTEIKDEEKIAKFTTVMSDVTNLTIYDKLVNGIGVKNKIYQDSDARFKNWSLELLNDNLVIEIIYDSVHDLIVYDGDDTRVVSYFCLSIVFPTTSDINEFVVYYSLTSNTDNNEKYNQYAANTPFVLYGNAEELFEFAKNI